MVTRDAQATDMRSESARCTRAQYIFLALPLGLLGLHNFAAGRNRRGYWQLGIGAASIGLGVAEPPLSILPLIALLVWIFVDIISVTTDGAGIRFGGRRSIEPLAPRLVRPSPPPGPPETPLKTYRVFALGASGAGKTCFLASMFRHLSVIDSTNGFYLTASGTQRDKLLGLFLRIADSYKEWPGGTIAESEWVFTAHAPSPRTGRYHPVAQFAYLDYAGGHLKDALQADAMGAQIRINEADAILVLIDGMKVYRRMTRTEHFIPDPADRLGGDLAFLLPYLNSTGRKPVHFVVTKWDIFQGFSLSEVKRVLLENSQVRGLVAQRSRLGAPTRLIPVSAVGFRFARMNEEGIMEKLAGADPAPYNVEVPMAGTLGDVFETGVNSLPPTQANDLARAVQLPNGGGAQTLAWVLALLEGVRALPAPYGFVGGALIPIARQLMANRSPVRVLGPPYPPMTPSLVDADQAIIQVVGSFESVVGRFEADFPDSILLPWRGSAARVLS